MLWRLGGLDEHEEMVWTWRELDLIVQPLPGLELA